MTVPLVPNPAPAEISPVGFSSTSMLRILFPAEEPSTTSDSTVLKNLNAFKLLIDLLY